MMIGEYGQKCSWNKSFCSKFWWENIWNPSTQPKLALGPCSNSRFLSGEKRKKIVVLLKVLSLKNIASFKNFNFSLNLYTKILLQKMTLTLILGCGSAVITFFQDYEKREKKISLHEGLHRLPDACQIQNLNFP